MIELYGLESERKSWLTKNQNSKHTQKTTKIDHENSYRCIENDNFCMRQDRNFIIRKKKIVFKTFAWQKEGVKLLFFFLKCILAKQLIHSVLFFFCLFFFPSKKIIFEFPGFCFGRIIIKIQRSHKIVSTRCFDKNQFWLFIKLQ